LLGPSRDGRLYLTGPRVQRTRIRALEIVQNRAPAKPSLACAAIDDVLEKMRSAVAVITLPTLAGYGLSGEAAVARTPGICRERIAAFA